MNSSAFFDNIPIESFEADVWKSAVTFSPDGQGIASGSDDKTIRVWDVQGKTYQETQTSGPVSKIYFSADGTHLITNLGAFKAKVEAAGRRGQKAESSHCLYVDDRWVYCKSRPVPSFIVPKVQVGNVKPLHKTISGTKSWKSECQSRSLPLRSSSSSSSLALLRLFLLLIRLRCNDNRTPEPIN